MSEAWKWFISIASQFHFKSTLVGMEQIRGMLYNDDVNLLAKV
jgi:hypothetical protein